MTLQRAIVCVILLLYYSLLKVKVSQNAYKV